MYYHTINYCYTANISGCVINLISWMKWKKGNVTNVYKCVRGEEEDNMLQNAEGIYKIIQS